jgi:hypothetical protein
MPKRKLVTNQATKTTVSIRVPAHLRPRFQEAAFSYKLTESEAATRILEGLAGLAIVDVVGLETPLGAYSTCRLPIRIGNKMARNHCSRLRMRPAACGLNMSGKP